jgi:1-acyl-sn-glycerol-3-phosphate acyltransferase
MDIPILFVNLPVQFRFVAKRSLFKMPFLGWHLKRSGHIPVDRERPREAMRSLDEAAEKIRAGSSVILFPEGHRSRNGKIGQFKSGSFYLAIQSGHLPRQGRPNGDDRSSPNSHQWADASGC